MCGIAGEVHFGGSGRVVDSSRLLRMQNSMTSRGPDGSGLWISEDGQVGFGHRRLSILDLSELGAQPMADETGELRVVFNGEIYNFRDLRASMEARGQKCRSNSDTEILLYLYREFGWQMVEKLRGMYAFAIWDRTNKGVLLARDPFGIKPLYYSDHGGTLRFASQVKALKTDASISSAPEPAGHVGFFLLGHVPEPYTLFREIRSLPAGATLWVGADGSRKESRFSRPRDLILRAIDESHESSGETIKGAVGDSVRQHLIADVPVGVFLSSGIDSCAVAALASEAGNGTIKSITLGFAEFRGTSQDETALAQEVASRYGLDHRTVWITRAEFEQDVEKVLSAMDQPSIDGINTYFVSKAAKQGGLKVALSGLGGDELFGGYGGFHRVPATHKAVRSLHAPAWLGRTVRVSSQSGLRSFPKPKAAGLLEYGNTLQGAYLLYRSLYMPWELPRFMDRDFVDAGLKELRILDRMKESTAGIEDVRLQVCALELEWYMKNQLLRDSDWAGMAHSLEIRVPLVDVNVLRSVVRNGVRQGHPSKQDLAKTPALSLPAQILERPKTGFGIPVAQWLAPRSASSKEVGYRPWSKYLFSRFTGVTTQ
jgi:asparagine synthase (glutamine-hydrolysing)